MQQKNASAAHDQRDDARAIVGDLARARCASAPWYAARPRPRLRRRRSARRGRTAAGHRRRRGGRRHEARPGGLADGTGRRGRTGRAGSSDAVGAVRERHRLLGVVALMPSSLPVMLPASRRCRSAAGSARRPGPARRAPTSGPARRAGASVSSWAARIVAYCAASCEPNSSGSSAPSATVAPASSSVGQRHRRQVAVDAERHVGDRAHLQRDAGVDDPGEQLGVLGGPDAVAEPVGVQVVEADPDVLGAAQLAAVRDQQQPGPLSDPERRRELGRAAAPFVVGQAEADDPAAGVLRGEPGQGPGVERVPGAVGGDHHRHPDARSPRTRRARVEDQVGEGGDPAERAA